MYVLQYVPDWASLAVRLVLEELGQPYRADLVNVEGGQLDTPEHRRLQPLGLIPALETPDGPMFETGAILLWLADRHGALAPAPKAPQRAAFLKWYVFTNNAIHPTLMQLFYPDRVSGEACIEATLTHARARMDSYMALLNDMVAAENPDWLSPRAPSILGYYIAVLMRWLNGYTPGHLAHLKSTDYPALHAILASLETRPAARAAAKAEGLGETIFTKPTLV